MKVSILSRVASGAIRLQNVRPWSVATRALATSTSPSDAGNVAEPEEFLKIVVTGAAGNLGGKVAKRLLNSPAAAVLDVPVNERPIGVGGDSRELRPTKFHLVLMDVQPCPEEYQSKNEINGNKVEYIQCDVSKYDRNGWVSQFDSTYAAFLFAAKNPQPDATCQDAYTSMIMNANMLEACGMGKTERIIYASSNHVVGGLLYEKGKIAPDAEPRFGTKYNVRGASMDSTFYASAKVAAEAQAKAMTASGYLNRVIILRIGFNLPGESKVSDVTITGNPKKAPTEEAKNEREKADQRYILNWWRGMHLANEDLDVLVDCCIAPRLDANPSRLIYVNAVSDNPNSRWSIKDNELGYLPVGSSASDGEEKRKSQQQG